MLAPWNSRGWFLAVLSLVVHGSTGDFCQAQTARELAAARTFMVESEVAAAGVKNPAVLAVMRSVPRHEFVLAELRQYAYADMALPIGEHQTISPPFVVGYMTQQLDLKPTDRVLEIGTGSGYQCAVLAGLAKQVYTIEIVPKLGLHARSVLAKCGCRNVEVKVGDGYQGWAEHAPFDKIMVTCSPEKVPRPLVDQLREGGRIVIPLGERYQQTLFSLVKQDGELVVESREPTFFVPMTGKAESLRGALEDGPLSQLINGGFEDRLDNDQPAGWYYVRQADIAARKTEAASSNCITFTNRVPGHNSQALQAIGVDGGKVASLFVEASVQARSVRQGQAPDQLPRLLISFFDVDRIPLSQEMLGPWSGTFDWKRQRAQLKVPAEARLAIVAIGLLGATGELSCDDIVIMAAATRTGKILSASNKR